MIDIRNQNLAAQIVTDIKTAKNALDVSEATNFNACQTVDAKFAMMHPRIGGIYRNSMLDFLAGEGAPLTWKVDPGSMSVNVDDDPPTDPTVTMP